MDDDEYETDEIAYENADGEEEKMVMETTSTRDRIELCLKQLADLKSHTGTVNRSRSDIVIQLQRYVYLLIS